MQLCCARRMLLLGMWACPVPCSSHVYVLHEFRFSGSVPLQLLLLSRLIRLQACHNELSGSLVLPQQLMTGNATQKYSFKDLDLEDNKVKVLLSAWKHCNKGVIRVSAAKQITCFTGGRTSRSASCLSGRLGKLQVAYMCCYLLQITGTIPMELLEWVGETLDLSSNALTGTLPLIENESIRVSPEGAASHQQCETVNCSA